MNQDQPNITQTTSTTGSHHAGLIGGLAAGLILALAGDAYLIVRSNNLNDQVAQTRQEAQTQIAKLGESTTSMLEQERQQLQAISDDFSGKVDTATSAVQKARQDRPQGQVRNCQSSCPRRSKNSRKSGWSGNRRVKGCHHHSHFEAE